jgi:hypothetical protein
MVYFVFSEMVGYQQILFSVFAEFFFFLLKGSELVIFPKHIGYTGERGRGV